jgi:hypothetical protein
MSKQEFGGVNVTCDIPLCDKFLKLDTNEVQTYYPTYSGWGLIRIYDGGFDGDYTGDPPNGWNGWNNRDLCPVHYKQVMELLGVEICS